MLWGFGLTEPGAGSDAGATQTRAVLENGSWKINGTKAFITNSGTDITGGTTITAVTGERNGKPEISNIIVPQDTPGFTRSKKYRKMGWRASDTRELSFVDAKVPEANLLGERGKGFQQFLTILDGGRISIAALSVGLAWGAYDEALKYAQERHQFGKPISKFQAIQFKLADMLTEIEHGKLMVMRAAWEKDNGPRFRADRESRETLFWGNVAPRRQRGRTNPRRLRIYGGISGFAILPGSKDQRDRRRNE